MIKLEQLKQSVQGLAPNLQNLTNSLDVVKIDARLSDLKTQTEDPNFWSDNQNSQSILKEIKQLETRLANYNRVKDGLKELNDLIEIALEMQDTSIFDEAQASFKKLSVDLETQTLATLLTGEYDSNNAIVSFHGGAGGTEAQDWAEMLYRMYNRWAEKNGYKITLLDYLDGDEAGLKSASILIEGNNVYGFLKSEGGVHRLVRISPFDSSGRRHTSFASVEVMPEITETGDIDIDDGDLRIDTYRASGAGGQHVNKTESAVRITHIPTGIAVACQNERSQHQNKDVAMKMLKSKLAEIKEREHLDHIADIKGEHKDNAWGSQIRSYVFMPYTMVKDHRTNHENGNISAVMDGDIDSFINAYLIEKSLGNI